MNQLLIAGIGAVVIGAGGFATGWRVNSWRNDSQQLAIEQAAEKAGAVATDAAVTAIKGLEKIYVPIKQKGETITRTEPVYVNCEHTPDGLRVVNEALSPNHGPADSPAGVPRPDPAH